MITDGVSLSLVLINVWRLAGDTLNITCNFLFCNYQVHRDLLITLYNTRKKLNAKDLDVGTGIASWN
jgi:hypothetical protein